MEVAECGHLFCNECINIPSMTKCPMCRCTNLKLKKPNRTLLRLLELVQGYCGNCGWVGTNEQYQNTHSKVDCVPNPAAVAISSGDPNTNALKPAMSTGFGSVNNHGCTAAPVVPLTESNSMTATRPRVNTMPSNTAPSLVYGANPPPAAAPVYGQPQVVFGSEVRPANNGMPISTSAVFPTLPSPTNTAAAAAVTPFGAPNPAVSARYPYPQSNMGGYPAPTQQPQAGGAYGVPTGFSAPQQTYPQQPQQIRPQPSGIYGGPSGYYPPVMAPQQQQPSFGGVQPSGSGIFVDGRGRANTLPVSANSMTTATGSCNVYINPFSGQAMNNPHPFGRN